MLNEPEERQGAAVHNGDFEVVDLDVDVINPGGGERGEQVLGGRDQDAFLHQASGVAYASHVPSLGFDLEPLEVHPPEDDTGVGGGRAQAQVDGDARVQANPREAYGRC